MNRNENLLSSVPLFAHCSRKEIAQLSSLCTEVSFAAGDTLTRQGEAGEEFFVVIDGIADVDVDGRHVGSVHSGDPVGEVALLDGERRTATVTALSPLHALVLSRSEFTSALDTSPGLSRALVRAMGSRLRVAMA